MDWKKILDLENVKVFYKMVILVVLVAIGTAAIGFRGWAALETAEDNARELHGAGNSNIRCHLAVNCIVNIT